MVFWGVILFLIEQWKLNMFLPFTQTNISKLALRKTTLPWVKIWTRGPPNYYQNVSQVTSKLWMNH